MRFGRVLQLEDSGYTSANVSFGDVNADGHLDVVLVKGRHWPLMNLVLEGDGTGGFAPPRPVGDAPDRSYSGVLVDLDGDGDLDLVVSNDDPDRKVTWMNDGTGHFSFGQTFGEPEWSTRYVSVADLDGDGLQDVILANRTGGPPGADYVCWGIGEGRFAEECSVVSTASATTITTADFNGDGAPDLVVPFRDGGQSYVHLNDGRRGFEERVPFGPPDATIRAAEALDADGDGVLDLAVIDERAGPALYLGRAGGGFDDGRPLGPSGLHPYAIHVADLDRDGRTDVILGYVEARPRVLFNDGGGSFTDVPFGDAEGRAYGFDVGDVDEDGVLDIGMARSDAPNVLYYGERVRD
jgi:hypothetical protein